jgi:RNA polymerase sigma factor (sigma-70 family)
MSDSVAMSEQVKRPSSVAKSAAARNIASAKQLTSCYDEALRVACLHGMRLPQLETLLRRSDVPAKAATEASPPLSQTSGLELNTEERSQDVDDSDDDFGDARRRNAEREQYWLRRDANLRTRWRRVGAWTSPGPGWLGRRHALCSRIAECRVRAIKNANVDRRLVDAFLDDAIEGCHAGTLGADEWTLNEVEAQFDLALPHLQKVCAELAQLRQAIREERALMVQHNRSLVAGIARRFVGQGMLLDDLIQEGTLGLLRAIDKFDPSRGFQFSTYAIWWIRQGVSRAVLEQGRSVRVPVHLKEQTTRLRNVEARLAHRLGRAPTRAEIGAEVGLPESKVQHLQQQLLADVSLQRPLYGDGDGELGDNLVDEHAMQPFAALDFEGLSEHMALALAQLDPRSRFVVTAHLGLYGHTPLTLEGISQQLGISRERVRQIEREALTRLRKSAQETHLAEYV